MYVNKNKKLIHAAIVIILLIFNSCGKYEDGPIFSLKSKTARLVGEWNVVKTDNVTIDYEGFIVEVDKLDDMILQFDKNGDCKVSFDYTYDYSGIPVTIPVSDNGKWDWDSKKEVVETEFDKTGKLDFKVMRLTKDELWFEDDEKNLWECEKVE